MATAIVMPKLGMTMQEGTVIEWPIAIGGWVEKGAVVLIIESEKAEAEVEATDSGYLRHIYAEPDAVVPCGTLLGALTAGEDDAFDPESFRAGQATMSVQAPAGEATETAAAREAPTGEPRSGAPATPAAKRLARDHQLDLGLVAGSGPRGRITREDVEAAVELLAPRVRVTDAVSLEVPEEGPANAPSVLLLPGFGTDASAFARQIPALSERFRARGVNPRGVGRSDAPDVSRYEVATMASDAAALASAPAHVVGTSLGAAAALELALAHPDRIRSLTLIAPLVRAEPRLLAVVDAWCELGRELPSDSLAQALLPWLFSDELLADDRLRKRALRGLAQTLSRVPAAALERSAAGLREWSGTREADLGRVSVPTLVVVAENDLLTPGGMAVAEQIPGAKCVVVAGSGHAVMLEKWEAVNEALLQHLDGVES
jgi:pimeloyl-ACP methyl ester carboxylesterase